ncbi:MAG: hypothetical protein M0P31_05970 [Solirubrobacteraceae bacterium]|nr:hypothetical protein [Solirubrobacteraceae bacterium]
MNDPTAIVLPGVVLSGFVRIVTHPRIFAALCRDGRATGDLIPDAFIAATVVTFDRGFARFPGVRWEEPRA